jgi:hypothetical protein
MQDLRILFLNSAHHEPKSLNINKAALQSELVRQRDIVMRDALSLAEKHMVTCFDQQ